MFRRREGTRLALGVATPLLALALSVSVLGWGLRAGWFEDGEPAVVLTRRATLRDAPSPRGAELDRALEGELAWILEDEGDWLLVRSDEAQGWVEASELGRVRPSVRADAP